MRLHLIVLSTVTLALPLVGQKDKGPRVGCQAPELGLNSWIQKTDVPTRLSDLRGKVVVVHTFAWDCSSCLKVGISLAVDLLAANAERGLRVISVTTPAYRDETEKVMKELGMRHAVAQENPFKSKSPYVDVSSNPITYMFVIGRSGELVWRGDPSTDLEECLAAVEQALVGDGGRGFDRVLHEELDKAVQLYFAGDYGKACKAAAKVEKRYGKKKGEEAAAVAADAGMLLERIEEIGATLEKRLEKAVAERDLDAFVAARDELRGFAGEELGKRIAPTITAVEKDAQLAVELERATDWRTLRRARPALFPLRDDRLAKKWVGLLQAFADRHEGSTAAAEARQLASLMPK